MPAWHTISTNDGVTLACHVQPGARRSEVVGFHGDALKIKIAAPPVDGAANEELARFVAEKLGVRGSAVSLLKGATSRQKVLLIKGVTLEAVAAMLTPDPSH